MKSKIDRITGGFTLIEVIVTLVALALLSAMMASYFGSSFTQSSASIVNLRRSYELNQVMEKISAKYTEISRWRSSTSYASGTVILSTASASNQGSFSSGGGISGTTEPSWNISVGATTVDNGITWTCVSTAPDLSALQTAIGTEGQNYTNAAFGSYRVINNHFIQFNDSTKIEETCSTKCNNYLKVTIGFRSDDPNRTGETLTTLFVRR